MDVKTQISRLLLEESKNSRQKTPTAGLPAVVSLLDHEWIAVFILDDEVHYAYLNDDDSWNYDVEKNLFIRIRLADDYDSISEDKKCLVVWRESTKRFKTV